MLAPCSCICNYLLSYCGHVQEHRPQGARLGTAAERARHAGRENRGGEGGKLRMHELARRIVLSRSNLTRLADRLEDARLVAREDTPHDLRGYHCVVTPAGLALRKKMWPVYKAEIERLFSRHVTLEEARTIGDALARAVKAARENSSGA